MAAKMHAARSPLARALAVRALVTAGVGGAALGGVRQQALQGALDGHPATGDETLMLRRLLAVDVADMPPPTDLVGVLLEAASQRLGGAPRAEVWRAIGVHPDRGRDLLARHAKSVDWPLWYTLRDLALPPGVARG